MQNTRIATGFSALVLATSSLQGASLLDYDAAIVGSGFAARTTAVSPALDGSNSVAFDFGAISGDATFEFILSGDPVGGGRDGFLAVATANSGNSLRYEQWDDTGQLGFTTSGVADNTFAALAAASPTTDTHLAYRWTNDTGTMDLLINGVPTDSIAGAVFAMPNGPGFLGNNAGLTEGMVGTISRVTTFDSALSDGVIASHSDAWSNGVPEPSGIALAGLAGLALLRRRR
jgi:MYXO-CTERM domain-containing protein